MAICSHSGIRPWPARPHPLQLPTSTLPQGLCRARARGQTETTRVLGKLEVLLRCTSLLLRTLGLCGTFATRAYARCKGTHGRIATVLQCCRAGAISLATFAGRANVGLLTAGGPW